MGALRRAGARTDPHRCGAAGRQCPDHAVAGGLCRRRGNIAGARIACGWPRLCGDETFARRGRMGSSRSWCGRACGCDRHRYGRRYRIPHPGLIGRYEFSRAEPAGPVSCTRWQAACADDHDRRGHGVGAGRTAADRGTVATA